jgi:hypothetical protein
MGGDHPGDVYLVEIKEVLPTENAMCLMFDSSFCKAAGTHIMAQQLDANCRLQNLNLFQGFCSEGMP